MIMYLVRITIKSVIRIISGIWFILRLGLHSKPNKSMLDFTSNNIQLKLHICPQDHYCPAIMQKYTVLQYINAPARL